MGVLQKDGYLKLVDRTKDLIKTGGEWIPSVQVENEYVRRTRTNTIRAIEREPTTRDYCYIRYR